MNWSRTDWCMFLLLVLYLDRCLSQAEHHPYCRSSCAGLRARSNRMNCLLTCDQDLTGIFYRPGRPAYIGLLPTSPFEADERDELEAFDTVEVPPGDVFLREPKDRSAFVRIGKRDTSAATKRRDEFVRIGKASRQADRSPFLIGRSYKMKDAAKRPSAFVRIGRDWKDEADDGSSTFSTYEKSHHAADLPDGKDEPEEAAELEKKASSFVRIGRKRGSFVRIGKYDARTNTNKSE